MQGFIDQLADTVLNYRNQLQQAAQNYQNLDQQAGKLLQAKDATIAERDATIAAGLEENKALKAQVVELTDEAIAADMAKGSKPTPILGGTRAGKSEQLVGETAVS